MTMETRRPRRRWLVLALVLAVLIALGFVAFQALDSPSPIDYYRVVDERTVAVGTISGPHALARVTGVSETPTAVTITVRTFYVQLGPSSAVGYRYESIAKLHDPLAGRAVIDGTSGLPVQRANCPPPEVYASPCP